MPRLNVVAIAVAVTIAAAGAGVIVQGIDVGVSGLRGVRLMAFLAGIVICVTGLFLVHREWHRRARAAAIAKLLPRHRARRRAWSGMLGAANDTGDLDSFLSADTEWYDEPSERLPVTGARVRAATRALLVSLEDELRRESARALRPGRRPACRRARLRKAGRAETRRRRVAVRPSPIPS